MGGPGDDGQMNVLIAAEYTEFVPEWIAPAPVHGGMLAVSDAAWLRLIWL